MLAQSCSSVFGAKQSASLLQRDHFGAGEVKLRWLQRRHAVEPVGRTIDEPVAYEIGVLVACTGQDVVAAGTGTVAQQLPQGRLVAPHQIEDYLGAAARRFDRARIGKVFWPARAIEG